MAYAKTLHRSPRIGTTWWIIDRDKRRLQIAESAGGGGMVQLVHPLIIKGRTIYASIAVAEKLDALVESFETSYMEREHGRAR